MFSTIGIIAGLSLIGCSSTDSADTGKTEDTDTGTVDTETGTTETDTETTETDTATTAEGYSVSGTAIDFATSSPATEGLCAVAVDPGPAITGGDPTMLSYTTIGANGAYTITGIMEKPSLGLVIIVQDCADEGTVYPTGTGISSASLAAVEDGGTIDNTTVFSISLAMRDGMVQSFGAVGESWDYTTAGILMGFVFDNAGVPLTGATVTGAGSTTYYLDTESADGMFTSGASINTATDAAASAVFAIPGAPITSYTCAADGYTFDSLTGGSLPGLGLFVAFYAD